MLFLNKRLNRVGVNIQYIEEKLPAADDVSAGDFPGPLQKAG